ncbi:MAG: hypothetical protein KAT68_05165 [Bacteroidales bacterium]|nr:hypothetical protein [Bacteroidales bacterium]
MSKTVLFFLIILFFISCKKENDPCLLLITPDDYYYVQEPNDILSFNISCSSINTLKKFTITSKTKNTFSKTELDTLINADKFYLVFEYQVPKFPDSVTILNLLFTLTDNGGNQTQMLKTIEIRSERVLEETAGHVMYSHSSEKYDAYNLLSGNPIHSEIVDSSQIHIMDISVDSICGNSLMRKWVSPAGIKFVRFNDFDYPNSTIISLMNSYKAGIKNDFIENLNEEDIILTKITDTEDTDSIVYVAIKIINIIDADSTDMDRYVFNIKK